MSIKHLKITIFTILSCIFVTITALVAYAANKQQTSPIMNKSENLISEEFSEHIESIAKNKFNDSHHLEPILSVEQLKKLEGQMNKEYGIREDILRLLEKQIPPENKKAKQAAIEYAKIMNHIYYHADQDTALNLMPKEYLALRCLSLFLHDSYLELTKQIELLMNNTPEREAHLSDISKRYFGWKVLKGHGLSTKQEQASCENGDYLK